MDDEVDGYFFLREGKFEDFEDCWRRSLLEFLEFSSNAAARKVDLRL